MTFLLIGAVAAAVAFACGGSFTSRIAGAVVGFLFGWLASWLTLPVLAWGFTGAFWLVFVGGMIGTGIGFIGGRLSTGVFILPVMVIANAVVTFSSWEMMSGREHHEVLTVNDGTTFSEDVSPIDIRTVRTVDQALAARNADRRKGQDQELGGSVATGTMNIQHVGGIINILEVNADGNRVTRVNMGEGLWWAGPLKHATFLRWYNNGTTPGYLLASATDAKVSYMVRGLCEVAANVTERSDNAIDVDGYVCEPLKMRYLKDGAHFGDNLMRHLYTGGYEGIGLTDASFELDSNGNPYWVVTTYEKTVNGFGGNKANGVVVVDPQSGEITPYTIAETPAWVDRIQPEDMVRDQVNWWGWYRDGWKNSVFGQKIGVKEATPGTSLVLGADGVTYWYTDLKLTSGGDGNNTSVGYVLVNSRTGEARQYTLENGGLTADRAKLALETEERVKKADLSASNMILYNVGGVETYFTALKGADGLPKMYGFVDMQTALVTGVGKTPTEALRAYKNALSKSGSVGTVADLTDAEEVLAEVLAVASEAGSEGTVYFLRVAGVDGLEFFGNSENFVELKWVREGDTVRITYSASEDPNIKEVSVAIQAFDRVGDALQGE